MRDFTSERQEALGRSARAARMASDIFEQMVNIQHEEKRMRRVLTDTPWIHDVSAQKRPKHHRK